MSYENEAALGKKTLGRYRLLRRIGHGGMGEVWLAEDPTLHRQVAIKILRIRDQDDQQTPLRFAREARAIATLHHPHILPVHDYGKQEQPDGQVITYIVMPYVSGGSLAQHIASLASSRMPQHEAITYLSQAAEAIDYAHQHGIIHRDVKPENLLLRDGTWLLLADFGLAYSVLADEQITTSGLGFGTPDYMSPEQAQGKAEMASDIYSLAVLAYLLFTGQLPFHGETGYATIVQHITMAPPPPRQFNPALSVATEIVLLRGLAKTIADRPSSAQAFVSELQQTLADASFAPTLPPNEELIPTLPRGVEDVDASITYVKPSPRETQRETQQKTLLTRRNVLLGSVALVAAGVGLSSWALAASQTKKPVVSPSPTAVPGSADRPLVLVGHNRAVSPLMWSPQEPVLASADSSGDRQVFLWDMQQILTEQITPAPYKAKQAFSNVANLLLAWSLDGKALAIGYNDGGQGYSGMKIEVYTSDLATFAPGYDDHFIIAGEAFHGLVWLNGNYLVTVTSNDTATKPNFFLHVWKFGQTKKPLATFPIASDIFEDFIIVGANIVIHTPVVDLPATTTLAFSTQHGLLVGDLNTSATPMTWHERPRLLFDSSNNAINRDDNQVGIVTGSRAGGMLAAIPNAAFLPQNVTVWNASDPNTRLILHTGSSSSSQLTALDWSPAPTDTLIAAGGSDGNIYIWDTTNTTLPIKKLKGPSASVSDVAWSSDGAWLAASYGDPQASILVWRRQEVLHGY